MTIEGRNEWVNLYKNGNSDEKECAKMNLLNLILDLSLLWLKIW